MSTAFDFGITAEKLYDEDAKLKKEDVQILVEWMDKQAHLPKLTEKTLAKFLHSCYYRIEPAKDAIDKYYTMRTHSPQVFAILSEKEIRNAAPVALITMLPKLTPQNYLVILLKLTDFKTDNFNFQQLVRFVTMVATLNIFRASLVWGVVAIFDMKGFTLSHLAKFDLSSLKRILEFVQEAAPIRIKGVHLINTVSFLDKILTLVKPFISTELYNMIQFHKTVDSLYKDIPKDCLPLEYNGELPSFKVLEVRNVEDLINNMDFFEDHQTFRVDENKRLDKSKNMGTVFGMEGTFKKLQLD